MKKNVKMSKFEKLLYAVAFVLVALSPVLIVFSSSSLAQVNFEVEKQKKEINTQEKKNESLKMKINELASLDKIQEIAKNQGLSYNNNNIKSITE